MTINGVSVVDFAAVLLASGLLRAVPLVVAGIGEAVAERAGSAQPGHRGDDAQRLLLRLLGRLRDGRAC